jgi:hypothetical protein
MDRACVIWDFRTIAKGIGDSVELLMAIELICETYKVNKVDLIIVCDPSNPNRGSFEDTVINIGNYNAYIPGYLSLIYSNPHIGNLCVLDSDSSVVTYLKNNDYVVVYPTLEEFMSRIELQLEIYNWLYRFNGENGYIPRLSFADPLKHWAYTTLASFLPKLPVVVNIRNNPWIPGNNRNGNLSLWYEFFRSCNTIPIQFILIGSYRERDMATIFNDLENVTHSKSYYTSVAQDGALVYCSPFFIGLASGLSGVAFFGDIPFTMFRCTGYPLTKGKVKCPLLESRHYIYSFAETANTLQGTLNDQYSHVDIGVWEETANRWNGYSGPLLRSNNTWV